MARRPTTALVIRAARRNIRKAQLSRIGIREPRSIGRLTRSRALYSRPLVGARVALKRRTR